MRLFLGVDGGGTKTEFVVIDEAGEVIVSHRAGSAYYPETGIEALQTLIARGIKDTLAAGKISPHDIVYACIGLPAYGEDGSLTGRLDGIAAQSLPGRYRCVNDMVCGWAGALGCRDGINIVAGTGSIVYGEFEGRSARAGGWGELFSDEGSAYWVAREALTLFSRMSDGRADQGPLYALIRGHFGVHADLDVCGAIYGPPALSRSQIAALAPLVSHAVRLGDAAAQRIFVAAAQELAAIAHAVRAQLVVPASLPLPVSCSGGMLQPDGLLTPLLEQTLRSGGWRYEFAAPMLPPSAGIALYAAKLAGSPLSSAAVARLAHGLA